MNAGDSPKSDLDVMNFISIIIDNFTESVYVFFSVTNFCAFLSYGFHNVLWGHCGERVRGISLDF